MNSLSITWETIQTGVPIMPCNSNGDIFVALHGSASRGKQWQKIAPYFPAASQHVAPDLPGYGPDGASELNGLTVRLTSIAAQICAYDRGIHLIGHSFGGTCAIQIANQLPNRILSLSVYEPIVIMPQPRGSATKTNPLVTLRVQMTDNEPQNAMDAICEFWNLPPMRGMSIPQLTELQTAILYDFDDTFKMSSRTANSNYTGPVHLIGGTASPCVVATVMQSATHMFPQANVYKIPGANHFGPFTHPDVDVPIMTGQPVTSQRCDLRHG